MDKEKGELVTKYTTLNSELSSAKREAVKLKKEYEAMEKEAIESRRLLEERISEDIKQGQGRKLMDQHIQELKLKAATQEEALNAEREKFKGETAAKQSLINRLQAEKEALLEKVKSFGNSEEEKMSLMKELEIEKAKTIEVKKLRMEITTLNSKLKRAENTKEETIKSVNALNIQLAEKQDNVQRLEKQIAKAESNMNPLTVEIEQLKAQLKDHMDKQESWKLEKTRTSKELDTLQNQLSAVKLEKEKLQAELSSKKSQIEKLRESMAAEIQSQVSKVVQERDQLAASERKVRNDFEDICLKHATLQVHKEKMEREIEDLHHDIAREKKAALSAERMRSALEEQLASVKDSSETERRSRSEVEVMKRKLTISLDSAKRQLQERTDQLLALQKIVNPRLSRSSSVSWEEASKDVPEFVDLAQKLEESEKARKKAEESKALLKAQLEDAKQRWAKTLDDKDSEYYASRRALLEDLASIATNPSTPPTPVRGSPTKRPLSSNLSNGNFQVPKFDLASADRSVANKENTSLSAGPEVDIKGKSQSEIEKILSTLQSSKNDLLGVYHDTSKNLVRTKEQLAEAMQANQRLERELKALKSNGTMGGSAHGSEEITEISLRLDAEISRNQELQESIRLYKSRSEEYYSKIETAETIVMKASRAEQFAKSQCREAEESLTVAKQECRQAEKVIMDLQAKLQKLEGELEDKTIDLNHSKEIQQRLSKEVEDFNNRWSSEMSLSHSSIEAMRKRYNDEIRSLSEELENQKQSYSELHGTRRQLERQIEELKKKETWQTEKADLEAQLSELQKSNEDSTLAYQDSQKRIGSLLSQVRTLRNTMNDITADRDQLQKDKRTLETRLTEISKEFEDLASSNLGRSGTIRGVPSSDLKDPDSEIAELRQELRKQSEASSIILERLRDSKAQLDEDRKAIEQERKLNEELQQRLALTDKEKKQLHLQLLEMEAQSLRINSADESKFLRQKVTELEHQLQEKERRHADDLRSSRYNDRSVRDLYTQISQKDKLVQKLQEENDMNEDRIKKLKNTLEMLQGEESTQRLAAKRAEREARDAKESSLRLEKELEGWKSRFESLTSNRLSRSEYGGRSFV
ncbi:hypothetical protein AWJ20_2488 [Sugiyamaella lignohabitans]|uniref:Uncharacterized protein n=1 Tax=Sugiyamaella lignohabitans TaxID=796027 RepID=A0A167F5Y7_9ASCO|nr:uncharacterized protein AWJ20_2488 [Sugiyamaella lignohabitans]ANB14875.1 hypothetical protein AWJ20_2488 [Sugiyamaella lignohabitans]